MILIYDYYIINNNNNNNNDNNNFFEHKVSEYAIATKLADNNDAFEFDDDF
jgi:ribonucleotide reductase beta subunit family protein with ferritin-like domain